MKVILKTFQKQKNTTSKKCIAKLRFEKLKGCPISPRTPQKWYILCSDIGFICKKMPSIVTFNNHSNMSAIAFWKFRGRIHFFFYSTVIKPTENCLQALRLDNFCTFRGSFWESSMKSFFYTSIVSRTSHEKTLKSFLSQTHQRIHLFDD